MHNRFTSRKALPLLLLFAMLIVSVAVILSMVVSADPAEIDDFGYQTVSGAAVLNDDTDLRFVFTIGSLDYDQVGVIVSKTVETPTYDAASCYTYKTTTVHSSIIADGNKQTAPDGRYYVAVKLTDIPHSYFDGTLYIRAFVKDTPAKGGGVRYSDVQSITVCLALGHLTHTVTLQYSGTASMTETGTRIGYCEGCNLYNVTQYGEQNACEGKKWTAGGGDDSWVDSRQISTVLAGGKHFYPDASNNYEGNDLIVEYSVLWNETLLNMMPRYKKSDSEKYDAVVLTAFATTVHGYDNYRSIGYWGLTDNVPGSDACIAGAFEYPNPMIKTSASGNPYPRMIAGLQGYSSYPNIGGPDQYEPEWGWHRIGIVYHEDVTNLAAVRDNGAAEQYKLTVTVYLDGEVVSVLSGANLTSSNGNKDYKLCTNFSDFVKKICVFF